MLNKTHTGLIVGLITLLSLASLSIFAQPKPYFYKSPRPSSFEKVLPGISSFNFIVEPKEKVNFIEAYFGEEIKKWMEATRPGIRFGLDYSKPGPEHVYVRYSFSYRTQIANNGVLWWEASNVRILFTVAQIDYEYEFSLPNFSVQGNNFGNHVLYNNMLRHITNHIYTFNSSSTLHLADYRSGYDENKLKSEWRESGCRLYEGIYEDIAPDNGYKNNKYTLALKYVEEKPCLIYLGGAYLFNDWKEGEYKAWLEPTATPSIFKAQWLMSDKTVSSAYVSFEDGAMRTSISATNENNTYIKLFPASTDNINIAGNSASEWSGTGFALKNGHIITNYHVIDGARSIEVHCVDGNASSDYTATVVATDKTNDLAIIKITDSRFHGFATIPYAIKTQVEDVGEDVWVLGYPLTQVLGNEIKLTTGVISSRSGYQGDVSTYQISAPVQPGNSGGPLFDSKGNVVGIINAGVPGADNVGYAIKTSYLKALVDSFSLTSCLPASNTISSLPLKDQVKRVKNFVYLLICSSKPSSQRPMAPSNRDIEQNRPSSREVESPKKPSIGSGVSPQKPSTSQTETSGQRPVRQIDNNGVAITNLVGAKATESRLRITQIRIQSSQTIIDFEYSNEKPDGGYFEYMQIDKAAHIIVDGKTYNLTKVSGIKISPEKTYFSRPNETLSFKAFFPPISKSAQSLSFIESSTSKWQILDVKLQ